MRNRDDELALRLVEIEQLWPHPKAAAHCSVFKAVVRMIDRKRETSSLITLLPHHHHHRGLLISLAGFDSQLPWKNFQPTTTSKGGEIS